MMLARNNSRLALLFTRLFTFLDILIIHIESILLCHPSRFLGGCLYPENTCLRHNRIRPLLNVFVGATDVIHSLVRVH